jgi:hypothetical protein
MLSFPTAATPSIRHGSVPKAEDGSWYTKDNDGTVISKMAAGAPFFDQMFSGKTDIG